MENYYALSILDKSRAIIIVTILVFQYYPEFTECFRNVEHSIAYI